MLKFAYLTRQASYVPSQPQVDMDISTTRASMVPEVESRLFHNRDSHFPGPEMSISVVSRSAIPKQRAFVSYLVRHNLMRT